MKKRLRSHEGANAVEFALILPILIILLYGMITGGIAYNRKLQMNHAAREASRYGATLPQDSADAGEGVDAGEMDAWFEAVFERLVVTGSGELTLNDTSTVLCVTHIDDAGNSDSRTVVGGAGVVPSPPPDTVGDDDCYPGAGVSDGLTGERVQVVAERLTELDVVFFRLTPTVVSQAISRYEDPPSPQPSPTST